MLIPIVVCTNVITKVLYVYKMYKTQQLPQSVNSYGVNI